MIHFLRPAGRSEEGFLLLSLLLVLPLLLATVAGSYRLITLAQDRVAMQSRLDICAQKIIAARLGIARDLTTGNQVIRLTAKAIAMTRGLKALGGPAGILAGSLGEAGLLRLNQGTASFQNGQLLLAGGREMTLLLCARTPFSDGAALCRIDPPLSAALRREPTLFPDVMGGIGFQSSRLVTATCMGGKLRSAKVLRGDPQLHSARFTEHYE